MKNKNRNIIKIFTFSIILISMLLILISCNNNADNSNNNQELEIKSISIDESTIPEFAYVGKLSISSIQLIILYINDETETINLEESFIDFPSQVLLNNEGQHTINVSYKGKTTQFNIEMRLESTQVFKLTIHNGYVISVNGNPYSGNGYKDKIFIDDFSSGSELKLKWDSDDNYDFFGWSTSNYNSDEASIFDKNITVTINLSQSKTIYALMTTKQYTATFNTNFSSIPNFSIKKNVFNSEEEIAKELSYDNYYFYGWTTEPISTAEAISGTYTNIISFPYVLSDDTTFFAVWYPLGLSFSSYIYYENSAKYSGYQVASYNGKLTNLNIPRQYKGEDVISISRDAFNSAESKLLQKISVPDTVVEIQDGAFSNCSSLKYIDVDASNLRFTSEMGVLYKLDKNILVSYPANKVTNIYEVESNCVNISQYAFYDAIIGTIILPEKVANIYDYAFNSPNIDYIDFSALNFSSLNIINDDIKSIFNNNINNIYVSENDITIAKLNLSNKYMLNSDNIVTSDETNLSKIFKSKVGEYDFIYRLIRNEYFDVSNTSIEIIGCDRTIDSIVIPDSIENYFVTSIGNSAFKDSINLNNVVLNNSLERILDDAFYNTLWIETIENNSIVNNGILYKYIGSNKEYKLGYDITKIAESAFRNNKNLEIIDLSNNNQLKNICAYAFYNCSNLDTFDNYLQNSTRGAVYIKDDLIKIDAYAFYNTKIKEIFNYNNSNSQLKVINYNAFSSCKLLLNIDLNVPNLVELASNSFIDDYSLENINIKNNDIFYSINGILYEKDLEDSNNNFLNIYPSGKINIKFNPSDPLGDGSVIINNLVISEYSLMNSNVAALIFDNNIKSLETNSIYIPNLLYVEFRFDPTIINLSINDINGGYENIEYYYFNYPSINDNNVNDFFLSNLQLKSDKYLIIEPYTFNIYQQKYITATSYNNLSKELLVIIDRKETVLDINSSNPIDTYKYAFTSSYITDITFTSCLNSIGDYTFMLSPNLTSINIQNNNSLIPVIYENSFGNIKNNIQIFVDYDTEANESYVDRWKYIFSEQIIDFTIDSVEHELISNVIYQRPKVILEYLDENNVLKTYLIINSDEIATYNIDLTKEGYDIGGWVDKSNNNIDLSTYDFKYNTLLDCDWIVQEFDVYFYITNDVIINQFAVDTGNTAIISETEYRIFKTKATYNTSYDFNASLLNSNMYEFLGWKINNQDDAKIDPAGSWKYTGNNNTVILFENISKKTYRFIYQESVMGTTYYEQTYNILKPNNIENGYEFVGWLYNDSQITNKEGKSISLFTINSLSTDINITPKFEPYKYSVSILFPTNNDAFITVKTIDVYYNSTDYDVFYSANDNIDGYDITRITSYYRIVNDIKVRYINGDGIVLKAWDIYDSNDCYLYAEFAVEVSDEISLKYQISLNNSVILTSDIEMTSPISESDVYIIGNNKTITLINTHFMNINYGIISKLNVVYNNSFTVNLEQNYYSFFVIRNYGNIDQITISFNNDMILNYDDSEITNIELGYFSYINDGKISDSTIKIRYKASIYDDICITPYIITTINNNDAIIFNINLQILESIYSNNVVKQKDGKIEQINLTIQK